MEQKAQADIVGVANLQTKEPVHRRLKETFGRVKSYEELTSQFVFYVPFVHNLVRDNRRIQYTTDPFSASLMQILDEHPMVITELSRPVFKAMPPILLSDDLHVFERALYVAPKEAWNAIASQTSSISAIDREKRMFCVFSMQKEVIKCPFDRFADRMMDIYICNLYGNKHTYYFEQDAETQSLLLQYHPPVKEFIDLAKSVFDIFGTTAHDRSVENFVSQHENDLLYAMRQSGPLPVETPKILDESTLTAAKREEIRKLIKMYKRLYEGEE